MYLCFGAVNYHATVLVNGARVGENEGGYLPFEFEVSRLLRPGCANEVAVEVTSPTDDCEAYPDYPFSETPFGKQSWYGPLSGIWQSVRLERRASLHVQAMRVEPRYSDGVLEAELTFAGSAGGGAVLRAEILVGDQTVDETELSLAAGAERATLRLRVADRRAWSPDDPFLYRLRVRLHADGDGDEIERTFGFRLVETRNGRIHLNGEPIFLRGALDQDYYPDGACTMPSEAFVEDQFRKAKALGLNCLRCHIKAPDPRYYDVADRVGLMIWTDLPNAGRWTEKSVVRTEALLRGMVERDRHHPSIVCWTIVNENWGTDLVHDPRHRAWLKKTYRWLKTFDTTRLVVDNSPLAPSMHVETDLADFHFYAGIPDHRAQWDRWIETFANRAPWTFCNRGDARRTGDEPLVVSEFGNWGLPDPQDLRGADGAEPWWFETGQDWGEGVMYPHGVEERYRACGLDRVFGAFSNFVEAAQWQQHRALKYQIESMRSRPSIAGYVITELTDCHWESNGLLDMRRNPRVFQQRLAEINADVVVLPRWTKAACVGGEELRMPLLLAHGAGRPIDDGVLTWSVEGGARESVAAPRLRAGDVVEAHVASFAAPSVAQPELRRLSAQLTAHGLLLAANELDLAVHPPRHAGWAATLAVYSRNEAIRCRLTELGYRLAASPEAAALVVEAEADESFCEQVRSGGRGLLLADRPQSLQPLFPHWQAVKVVAREGTMWMGDWASSFSWLRRAGVFARLPGGPLLDHSFNGLIPDHVISGCNVSDYRGRVHAGIVVGWVHKPAALVVERDYGRGRFMVSTFRVIDKAAGADVTADALLDALVEHASETAQAFARSTAA